MDFFCIVFYKFDNYSIKNHANELQLYLSRNWRDIHQLFQFWIRAIVISTDHHCNFHLSHENFGRMVIQIEYN